MATTASKLMEKDEQLQLCIQRFVSDTQSMINQFSELFIGELRRFADVCMEFSVSYRSIQEDRQFLSAENKSLKDELDVRTAEVDFLGKELREIREENDELIRKIECLNINSDGEISMMIHHDRPRDYAVVNSMPAFPRRYSSATGYEPPASSAGSYHHREEGVPIQENTEFNLSTESSLPSTNSKNQLMLLTPPIAFKTNIANNNNIDSSNNRGKLSPSGNQSSDETSSNNHTNETIRSHSRDDISTLYAHLLNHDNNNNSDSGSNQLIGVNSGSSRNSDRSPSLDEIRGIGNAKIIQMVYNQTNGLQEQRTLSTAVSSSAGTFYDCSNQIRQLFGRPTETISDQHQQQQSSSINTTMVSPQVIVCHGSNDENDGGLISSPNIGQSTMIDGEMKKRHPTEITTNIDQSSTIDAMYANAFIAKTPSPNYCDYGQHLDKYRCDNDHNNDKESGAGDVDEFLLNAPPVQRYNSKKLSKKRKSRRRAGAETNRDNDQHLLQQNQPDISPTIIMPLTSIDSISIIPSPKIDLNRYLLVEICHIVSPSHFYLIINDEKIGTNAFEDFLERFQNFYKSVEAIGQDGNVNDDDIDDVDDEERQLRMLVSIPPSTQTLTIGSYWACYIDDELDWRRVQIIERSNLDDHYSSDSNNHDEFIMVKDVDSGYSSLVHIQMIRPLTYEMAQVPAFAVRSSLAFIYPHHHHQQQSSHVNNRRDDQYYDQWPMECCQFFEDMTYDQILTASVLQINHSNGHQQSLEINGNLDDEIAHVLLWCTSAEDYEIFINRKLIELNYASNVADDDSWMDQFNEVLNNNVAASPSPESPNIETCFNIQLAKPTDETAIVATVLPPAFQTINNNDNAQPESNGSMKSMETAPNTEYVNPVVGNNESISSKQMDRKIKIKTRSKKKKGSLNEAKDENNECPDSCINRPAVPIPMIGDVDVNGQQPSVTNTSITNNNTTTIESETNYSLGKTSNSITVNNEKMIKKSICSSSDNRSFKHQQEPHSLLPPSSPSPSKSPNSLLQLSIEPIIQISIAIHHSTSIPNNNIITHEQKEIDYLKQSIDDSDNHDSSIFDHYCHTLHHDPRLSNWIIQKHSRHVVLKKTFMPDKISYLLFISCYFEPNKFIGILPFGERKIDSEQLGQFVRNTQESQTPFRQFVSDMTEFYRQEQSSSLRLLPEQCVFEQNNTSSTIVFYDQQSGLFLRGHIVGRDMIMESQNVDYDKQQQQQESITESKSVKDLLKVPNDDNDDRPMKQKKTLSLRRRSLHDYTTRYIIYAIDVGRYFQVPLKHIYHLDDRFKMAKPFAIVCKLHGYPNNKSKLSKIRSIIMEKKFFGIRFIDIDFSTERFAVELFTVNLKDEESSFKMNRPSSSWRTSSPLISKNLIHLI
ncbi:LOW QUALITY PROTEIN: uncharacterized protein LOC124492361 [Dermatophagoides farinae]|uniref:LOW QUALITY PROTEIN: uncharacterized protein LOC124492361 n=1 Tax=Dermatophagoides farinae TaxID=6954 RepID=UPI003F634F9D